VTERDLFFMIAGALATFAALFVLLPLLRTDTPDRRRSSWRTLGYAAGGVLAMLGAAFGLYAWRGAPSAIGSGTGGAPPAAPHAVAGAGQPGTMEAATSRLAARLARDGGTAADWQLLAKSYEFMGRADEAREAAAKAAALGAAAAPAAEVIPAAAATSTSSPPSSELARAEKLRREHDFKGAAAIYQHEAALGRLTADAWADYADTAASLNGGKLAGEPARFIAEALRLDPRHPKALWLNASLAHEQRRYADALAGWRALRAVLPADSPDQRIIAANIEEATRLSGGEAPPLAAPASPGEARIAGTVELATALAQQAPRDATLFIYAKSPDAGGPPLAVLRLRPDHWPVSFVLDDSEAMIPGRALSGAPVVRLEARISRSGNALPQAGDLIGAIANVNTRAGRAVHIAIDHPIS
jgi:cytochrome c-type biogenesis protein CcmH